MAEVIVGEMIGVTQTEMINIIKKNPGKAMTVKFHKKPCEGNLAEALRGGQQDMTDRQWKSLRKKCMAGEERIYRGRHELNFNDHGRLYFFAAGESGIRQLDLRTVVNVVVDGISYFRK